MGQPNPWTTLMQQEVIAHTTAGSWLSERPCKSQDAKRLFAI